MEQDKDIRIGYFQAKGSSQNSTGYICAALRRPPKGSESTEYHCAFSFCSPNDVFIKKLAREIAFGRLRKNKAFKFDSKAKTIAEVFIEGMKYAVDNSVDIAQMRKIHASGHILVRDGKEIHNGNIKDFVTYVPHWAKNRTLVFGLNQSR